MTFEEINAKLYSTPEIYRPPLERDSALLEVATGCSYAKCKFCDFANDRFHLFSMEEIEEKIRLLSLIINGNQSLHFLGCNALCLSTEKLLAILNLIHQYLPSVVRVSMYARADDILRKSPEELLLLRKHGVQELHVGLESGSAKVLELHNKGVTPDEMLQAFERLDQCGIGYHLNIILGLGGTEYSAVHAVSTARFISKIHPRSVWGMALVIWPNTPLKQMIDEKKFFPMTPRDILLEEKEMMEQMNITSTCLYVDSTALKKYSLIAILPEQKATLLQKMEMLLQEG